MLYLWPLCLNSAQQCLSAGTTSITQNLQTTLKPPVFLGCCFVQIYYKRVFSCSPLFHPPPHLLFPLKLLVKENQGLEVKLLQALPEHWDSEELSALAQKSAFYHIQREVICC